MNGQVNERDPDIQSRNNEVEASLGDLEQKIDFALMRPDFGNS